MKRNHQSRSDDAENNDDHQPPRQLLRSDSECSGFRKRETLFFDFPPEIISLILIRLPVNTLLMLKCVCKYFSRLVSSPEFIREHVKFSTEDASMSSYKLMIEAEDNYTELMQVSIQSLCDDDIVTLDHPRKEVGETVRIVGSSNGLVVILVDLDHLFVWNPTIRKHKKLPLVVGHERLDDDGHGLYYGFGYDACNDDYKVVALFQLNKCPITMMKTGSRYEVNVYSLKSDCWTRISDTSFGESPVTYGMLASGKIHWSIGEDGDIVSFDLTREVFGTLELPNYEKPCVNPPLNVMGGSITLCCDYGSHLDVWVMKEYGIKDSWSKMFTLSGLVYLTEACSVLPNGEVLLYDGSLFIYNPKDNSSRSTDICLELIPYIHVESLVSPFCY